MLPNDAACHFDASLGLVEFMLPNPCNVYLDSTPAQALFGESRRDFSHGGVRVSDPVTVTLKHRIRVFIVNGTALATEDGDVRFFDLIHGHDQRLLAALQARRPRRVVR